MASSTVGGMRPEMADISSCEAVVCVCVWVCVYMCVCVYVGICVCGYMCNMCVCVCEGVQASTFECCTPLNQHNNIASFPGSLPVAAAGQRPFALSGDITVVCIPAPP